jgi:hypothetical protein
MKNELPDWVLCHKSQGREIKKHENNCLNDLYPNQ